MVSTRAEARRTGAKWYFTGKACSNGHIARRYSSGKCEECNKMKNGTAEYLEYQRNWYGKNDLRHRDNVSEYKRENRHKVNELHSLYRAQKADRTPSWIKRDFVEVFFDKARVLTQFAVHEYEVDHVVPLFGVDENGEPSVCGLHWEGNLQVLTGPANRAKSNRWTTDMGYS